MRSSGMRLEVARGRPRRVEQPRAVRLEHDRHVDLAGHLHHVAEELEPAREVVAVAAGVAVDQDRPRALDPLELVAERLLVVAEHHRDVVEPELAAQVAELRGVDLDRRALDAVPARRGELREPRALVAEILHAPVALQELQVHAPYFHSDGFGVQRAERAREASDPALRARRGPAGLRRLFVAAVAAAAARRPARLLRVHAAGRVRLDVARRRASGASPPSAQAPAGTTSTRCLPKLRRARTSRPTRSFSRPGAARWPCHPKTPRASR